MFSVAARAAELYTPPLSCSYTGLGEAELLCMIANVSDRAREVTIEIVEVLLIDQTKVAHVAVSVNALLEPGVSEVASYPSPFGPGSYCKFTVEGLKRTVRASSCIAYEDPNMPSYGCRVAVAAE